MGCLRIAPLMIFLIFVVPRQSDGSFHEIFRYLAQDDRNSEATNQMSPSPSPSPAANVGSGKAQGPVNQPKEETCDKVFHKCDIKDYNITACVPSVGNGSQAAYMLILNGGASSLKSNIVFHPLPITPDEMVIPGHQVKKVNLPSGMGGNSSIVLTVGNRNCIIQLGAVIPPRFYTSHLTPITWTYVLFVAAVFTGGTWACCKLVKRRRHLDGISYQELEMGQRETDPSVLIETPEGWDEDWDDDWDEDKEVGTPGAKHSGKNLEKGGSLKYIDTDQWANGWDN